MDIGQPLEQVVRERGRCPGSSMRDHRCSDSCPRGAEPVGRGLQMRQRPASHRRVRPERMCYALRSRSERQLLQLAVDLVELGRCFTEGSPCQRYERSALSSTAIRVMDPSTLCGPTPASARPTPEGDCLGLQAAVRRGGRRLQGLAAHHENRARLNVIMLASYALKVAGGRGNRSIHKIPAIGGEAQMPGSKRRVSTGRSGGQAKAAACSSVSNRRWGWPKKDRADRWGFALHHRRRRTALAVVIGDAREPGSIEWFGTFAARVETEAPLPCPEVETDDANRRSTTGDRSERAATKGSGTGASTGAGGARCGCGARGRNRRYFHRLRAAGPGDAAPSASR